MQEFLDKDHGNIHSPCKLHCKLSSSHWILQRLLRHFPCYFHDPDDYVQQHGIRKSLVFQQMIYIYQYVMPCRDGYRKYLLDFHERFSKN